MVLEAIYVVRHGVSCPSYVLEQERMYRMSNNVHPTNGRHCSVIERSRGHFLVVDNTSKTAGCVHTRRKCYKEWHAVVGMISCKTDLMTSTTPLCRETILMVYDSSALTGWSIPLPESTTVPFARQLASLQIQLSPAMAFSRPRN